MAQGLEAEVWIQDSSRRSSSRSCFAGGQRVVGAKGEVQRVVEQLEPPDAGPEPLADAFELVEQDEIELAGP